MRPPPLFQNHRGFSSFFRQIDLHELYITLGSGLDGHGQIDLVVGSEHCNDLVPGQAGILLRHDERPKGCILDLVTWFHLEPTSFKSIAEVSSLWLAADEILLLVGQADIPSRTKVDAVYVNPAGVSMFGAHGVSLLNRQVAQRPRRPAGMNSPATRSS